MKRFAATVALVVAMAFGFALVAYNFVETPPRLIWWMNIAIVVGVVVPICRRVTKYLGWGAYRPKRRRARTALERRAGIPE